jgi:triacylglycerol lipase
LSPFFPVTVFIIELVFFLLFGMAMMGDSMMHRLGELTICFIIWLVFFRIVAVLASFLFAFRNTTIEQQQSTWSWMTTFFKELAAVLAAFTVFIPLRCFFAPRIGAHVAKNVPLILFVHGLASNSGVWWLFGRRLKRMLELNAQVVQIDSFDLGKPNDSLERYVQKLDQHLQYLQLKTSAPIVLVGHSMGGLICRAWFARQTETRVAGLITIGTPHQGSQTARWLNFPNMIQMRPDSDWLKHLSQMPCVRNIALYSIHDNLVIPYIAGASPFFKSLPSSGLGHLSLLFNKEIVLRVVTEIDELIL